MEKLYVVFLLFLSWMFIHAQDSLKNSITTYGIVELNVPADFATVSFSIKPKGSSLREAVEKAKHKTEIIAADLKHVGIKEKNISTTYFYSGENVGGKSFFSSKNDYKTEITTFVKVDSLTILEEVVLKISDHEPDVIKDISFELNNPEKHKMKAVSLAIKKAKQKSEIAAHEIKATINKIIQVEEIVMDQQSGYQLPGLRANPFNAIFYQPVLPGKSKSFYSESIKITCKIKLVAVIN